MKTLLVALNDEEHARDALRLALPIARAHGSHLIGLHTIETLAFYPGVSIHIPGEIYTTFVEARDKDAEGVKALFEEMTRPEDFPSEWRGVHVQSPDASDKLVEAAHTTDLVIMAAPAETEGEVPRYHAHEQVIRRSGRPVLHVPSGYTEERIGHKVVIGWSPTREAARAVHDALPLLAPGAEVSIVTVAQRAGDAPGDATELARALDRHGFKVDVVEKTATRGKIAEELDEMAFGLGADLIVTGAFGHSRLYDFVIGAVTIDLLERARLPVLFSR